MNSPSQPPPLPPEPALVSPAKPPKFRRLQTWLDGLILLSWGGLLLKYRLTGQLNLLIHPNYFWLVLVTGISLLGLGSLKLQQLIRRSRRSEPRFDAALPHISLMPPLVASGLLLVTALLGFLIPPQVLTSHMALQRGITESLPLTRSQPESFRVGIAPEERSLIDWVRTLDAYPEPDAYVGQIAKVEGFVVRSPELPEGYILLCRFILTCCAVDAYPVGIPVKLPEGDLDHDADTWLTVDGTMMVDNLISEDSNKSRSSPKRQLILVATTVSPIPTPDNPYAY